MGGDTQPGLCYGKTYASVLGGSRTSYTLPGELTDAAEAALEKLADIFDNRQAFISMVEPIT